MDYSLPERILACQNAPLLIACQGKPGDFTAFAASSPLRMAVSYSEDGKLWKPNRTEEGDQLLSEIGRPGGQERRESGPAPDGASPPGSYAAMSGGSLFLSRAREESAGRWSPASEPDQWKVFVGELAAGCLILAFGAAVAIFGVELDWLRLPATAISILLGLGGVWLGFADLAKSRQDWRQLLAPVLLNAIFAIALALTLLPLIAILRGATALLSEHPGFGLGDAIGTSLAFIA